MSTRPDRAVATTSRPTREVQLLQDCEEARRRLASRGSSAEAEDEDPWTSAVGVLDEITEQRLKTLRLLVWQQAHLLGRVQEEVEQQEAAAESISKRHIQLQADASSAFAEEVELEKAELALQSKQKSSQLWLDSLCRELDAKEAALEAALAKARAAAEESERQRPKLVHTEEVLAALERRRGEVRKDAARLVDQQQETEGREAMVQCAEAAWEFRLHQQLQGRAAQSSMPSMSAMAASIRIGVARRVLQATLQEQPDLLRMATTGCPSNAHGKLLALAVLRSIGGTSIPAEPSEETKGAEGSELSPSPTLHEEAKQAEPISNGKVSHSLGAEVPLLLPMMERGQDYQQFGSPGGVARAVSQGPATARSLPEGSPTASPQSIASLPSSSTFIRAPQVIAATAAGQPAAWSRGSTGLVQPALPPTLFPTPQVTGGAVPASPLTSERVLRFPPPSWTLGLPTWAYPPRGVPAALMTPGRLQVGTPVPVLSPPHWGAVPFTRL